MSSNVTNILCILCMAALTVESRYLSNQFSMQRLPTRRFLQRRLENNALPNNVLYRRVQGVLPIVNEYSSIKEKHSNPKSDRAFRYSSINSKAKVSKETGVYENRFRGFKSHLQRHKTINILAQTKIFPEVKPRLEINLKLNGPRSTNIKGRKHISIKANHINSFKVSNAARGTHISLDKKGLKTNSQSVNRPTLQQNIGVRNVYHTKPNRESQSIKRKPISEIKGRSFIRDTNVNNAASRNVFTIYKASTFNPKAWIMDNTNIHTTPVPFDQNLFSTKSTSTPFSKTVSTLHALPKIESTSQPSSQTTIESTKPNKPVDVPINTTHIPFSSTGTEEIDLPDGPDIPDLPEVPETATSESMLD